MQWDLSPRLKAYLRVGYVLQSRLRVGALPKIGQCVWPEAALQKELTKSLTKLDMPSFCRRYPALLDALLKQIVQIANVSTTPPKLPFKNRDKCLLSFCWSWVFPPDEPLYGVCTCSIANLPSSGHRVINKILVHDILDLFCILAYCWTLSCVQGIITNIWVNGVSYFWSEFHQCFFSKVCIKTSQSPYNPEWKCKDTPL